MINSIFSLKTQRIRRAGRECCGDSTNRTWCISTKYGSPNNFPDVSFRFRESFETSWDNSSFMTELWGTGYGNELCTAPVRFGLRFFLQYERQTGYMPHELITNVKFSMVSYTQSSYRLRSQHKLFLETVVEGKRKKGYLTFSPFSFLQSLAFKGTGWGENGVS